MVRWNKQLSKAFDVNVEYLAPSALEYDWVSKFLEVPIKDVYQTDTGIRGPKMGAWLSACKAILLQYKLASVRNIQYNGTEAPPIYEVIQLNSKLRDDFLVEGMAFYKAETPFIIKFSPRWWGLAVTLYSKSSDREFLRDLVGSVHDRSKEYNFLKNEAFSLSGEFIARTDLGWSDVFLTQKNERAVKLALAVLNEKGKDMPARGMIFMGAPGNGKTLSGKVMLNQAKATFIWLSALDMTHYGGFGAISEAFDLAKELAPTVLFFEDIDTWLYSSTTDLLKTEMDGLSTLKGVTTILTTNFPEQLPEALIDRPGRFHDVLRFDPPDAETRTKMVGVWLPLIDADTIELAVAETKGMSGAHVRELCNFAKTIKEQENLDWKMAVVEAITKVKEQRDLVAEARKRKSIETKGTSMKTYEFKSQFDPADPKRPVRMNFTTPPEAKEFDDGQMTVVHFVSTESQDRGGDIVRAEGIDDANYRTNPVVLYGHDHNAFPIGKSLWRKVTTRNGVKGYLAKTQFAPTDEGKKAYELWKGDFLNAASIGFIPVEYDPIVDRQNKVVGHDFLKSELLEYSIVPVPMNAEAVKAAIQKSIGSEFSVKAAERMLKATEGFVNRQLRPQEKDEVKTEKEYLADILTSAGEILGACKAIDKSDDEHVKAIRESAQNIVLHCGIMESGEPDLENDPAPSEVEQVQTPAEAQEQLVGEMQRLMGEMQQMLDKQDKKNIDEELQTRKVESTVAASKLISDAVDRVLSRLTGIITD